MFCIVFYPLPGPGTSPIRCVSKFPAILDYVCVRSSDVIPKLALGNSSLMCETKEFTRPPHLHKPRVPIETNKTRNAVWIRVHQISARDDFPPPVSCQKRVFVANDWSSFRTPNTYREGTWLCILTAYALYNCASLKSYSLGFYDFISMFMIRL